jgi:hypothetical protein
MAYVVARRGRGFEIRESVSTAAGPRSRTLATFRSISPGVIEQAAARATTAFDARRVWAAAVAAGARTSTPAADVAARALLTELALGRPPSPGLRRHLAEALRDGGAAAGGIDEWLATSPRERGLALRDLLALADRLPRGERSGPRFPRLRSSSAPT